MKCQLLVCAEWGENESTLGQIVATENRILTLINEANELSLIDPPVIVPSRRALSRPGMLLMPFSYSRTFKKEKQTPEKACVMTMENRHQDNSNIWQLNFCSSMKPASSIEVFLLSLLRQYSRALIFLKIGNLDLRHIAPMVSLCRRSSPIMRKEPG